MQKKLIKINVVVACILCIIFFAMVVCSCGVEMKEKLKAVILVPYVASSEDIEAPSAEAEFLYADYFKDAQVKQVLGSGLEGRIYIKNQFALYIIGVGKTNASMYCTALLNSSEYDLSETKFIEFGCCGAAKDVGVVGDLFLVGEVVDGELGHHADARESQNNSNHSWYPNESFTGFSYINLENDFYNETYELIKDENLVTTPNARKLMGDTFDNEDWAVRDPKVLKACSVTGDMYWKGNYDHDNAKYITQYYKCKYPFAASDMEDVAVAQVFKNYNKLDSLIIMRFAVNVDVFIPGQTPEMIWSDGSSFESTGFDGFDDAFGVIAKRATEIVQKVVSN